MHAAVESGVPAAVPAVLVHMDHEVAVFELTARNCSGLRDATSIGTGNVYGNSSGDDDEELQTVIMLAALSGNLDMFHTVLEAMKEKLPTAKQVQVCCSTPTKRVLALQDCCSGLQLSACACACVRVCVYARVWASSMVLPRVCRDDDAEWWEKGLAIRNISTQCSSVCRLRTW